MNDVSAAVEILAFAAEYERNRGITGGDILTRIQTHPPDRIHELISRLWKQRFIPTATPTAA